MDATLDGNYYKVRKRFDVVGHEAHGIWELIFECDDSVIRGVFVLKRQLPSDDGLRAVRKKMHEDVEAGITEGFFVYEKL